MVYSKEHYAGIDIIFLSETWMRMTWKAIMNIYNCLTIKCSCFNEVVRFYHCFVLNYEQF